MQAEKAHGRLMETVIVLGPLCHYLLCQLVIVMLAVINIR